MKRSNMMVFTGVFLVSIVLLTGCPSEQSRQRQASPPPMPLITPDQINSLESAAKMTPKNPAGWIALGNALMDTRQFPAAIDAYKKALALDPNNVDVRVDMGTCYRGSGQPEKAIEEYRKAIKINPNHLNAHRNAGVVLAFDLKKPLDAAKAFERYLELAPNSPDAADIRHTIDDLKSGGHK